MKAFLKKLTPALVLGLLASANVALGVNGTADLELRVEGTINSKPVWKDKDGKIISFATLSFDGIFSGESNEDRDSKAYEVSLHNMDATKPNVTVTLPQTCKIGTVDVVQQFVQLLVNDIAIDASQPLPFEDGVLTKLALRFSGAGGYGDDSGAVTCDKSGMLSYQY